MSSIELTPREQEILKLLCQGFSNGAIAERLVLSLGTVKWYNKQIFAKLGVNNRVQATLAANKLGLLATTSDYSPPQPLPLPLTSFIGREEIIDKVCALLQQHRLVTIVGQGGIGKTRLALEVGRREQDNQHFALNYVPLATCSQAEAIPLAIADHLRITILAQQPIVRQVIDALSRQPTLLILDNFEHLLSATPLIITILRSVAHIRLLVTSREPLNLYGEMVFPLNGLSLPEAGAMGQEQYSEAIRLFVDRAQLADANFQPTDDNLGQIIDICRQLQGMPLAIEHAASWIQSLDPEAISAEIQHGLDILQSGLEGIERRHQNMRAVIAPWWERLTSREQYAMMRLCVFRGGFRREAAAVVAQTDLEILTSLIRKSFLSRINTDRYDMHELHRQFAFEKLTIREEIAGARERHARFFEERVRHTAPQRWNMEAVQVEALDRLDEDYENLREAIQWSLFEHDGCLALSMLSYGAIFFHDRGHGAETVGWTRAALERCTSRDAELRTRAYFALALQDPYASDQEHHDYLEWANRSGKTELIAVAYWQCGDHAAFNHAYNDSQRYYEHALELAAQTEHQSLYSSIILNYMGGLAEKQGNLELATHYYRDSYEQMRLHGVRSAARPLNLGRMMLLRGDEAQALELFRIALDNAIYLSSPLWAYETLLVIASALQTRSDLTYTIELLGACYTLAVSLRLSTTELQSTAQKLRDHMNSGGFDRLWTAGTALSTVDAIGLAQQTLEEVS